MQTKNQTKSDSTAVPLDHDKQQQPEPPAETEPLLIEQKETEANVDNSNSYGDALNIITPPNTNPIQEAVEAVDVTLPSPSSANGKTTGCGGNCFKSGKKCKKRWINSSSSDKNTPQMSQVYCPTCDDYANETPACLNKMPDKKSKAKPKTILSVESELVVTKRGSLKFNERKTSNITNVTRSSSLNTADRKGKKPDVLVANKKDKPKTKEKEKEKDVAKERTKDKVSKTSSLLAKVSPKKLRANRSLTSSTMHEKTIKINTASNTTTSAHSKKKQSVTVNNGNNGETKSTSLSTDNSKKDSMTTTDSCQEYEIADDAISLNGGGDISQVSDSAGKMIILAETDSMITVRGKEELPVVEEPSPVSPAPQMLLGEIGETKHYKFEKCVRVPVTTDSHPLQSLTHTKDECTEAADTEVEINVIENLDNNSSNSSSTLHNEGPSKRPSSLNDCNGNLNSVSASASCSTSPLSPPMLTGANVVDVGQMSATLPRTKAAAMQAFYNRALTLVPKRRTPDGTQIYYWCDLSKKALQGEIGCYFFCIQKKILVN